MSQAALALLALLAQDAPPAAITDDASVSDEAQPAANSADRQSVQGTPDVPATPSFHLVYTGDLGGVGQGRSRFSLHTPADEVLGRLDGRVMETHLERGLLARGPFVLWADGSSAALVDALQQGVPTCSAPEQSTTVVGEGTDLLIVAGDKHPWMDQLGPVSTTQLHPCTAPDGTPLTVASPVTAPAPGKWPDSAWAIDQWEFRRGMRSVIIEPDGTRSVARFIGAPAREASRTFARAQTLLAEDSDAPPIFVDAGNFLDGVSSVRDGELSLHRPLGYRLLKALSPTALVPGRTELAAGATAFLAEQAPHGLPYIATNWSSEADATLPQSRTITLDTAEGPVRVAFVGILDPSLATDLPQLAEDGVQITDPIDGVQPVIDALAASESPPQLIIALTTASGPVLERIRRELRGVDILLGDPTFATLRTTERTIEFRPVQAEEKAAPVTLPMDGLAQAHVALRRGHLHTLTVRPQRQDAHSPTDGSVTAAITRVRAAEYPALDVPLMEPPEDADRFTEATWSALVCEAVRTGTDADIVLLDRLPPPPAAPGRIHELAALDSLALLDTLEVHRIPGDQIQRLGDRVDGHVPVVCGIEPGSRIWKVGPRWLDADRSYRVVTTPATAHATGADKVLDSLRSSRILDLPGQAAIVDPTTGAPVTLRHTVLDTLRSTRDEHGQDGVAQDLLVDSPAAWDPLWLLRVRELGIETTSFSGVDDPAFATVPETLATSPSSFTFGSVGDVALEYSGADLWGDLRTRAAFTRLRAGEEDPEEIADDLVYSGSVTVARLGLPAGPLTLNPFAETAYDTELTEIEVADGGTGIKQADLSQTIGLSAQRAGPLRTLRLGAFVNRDMARLDDKPPEVGGALNWETLAIFGPSLKWSTTGDLRYYGRTEDDDASDLRVRALADTRLLMPLSRHLELGLFGQVFSIRGRTSANDTWATSTTVGLTLDVSGAFRL